MGKLNRLGVNWIMDTIIVLAPLFLIFLSRYGGKCLDALQDSRAHTTISASIQTELSTWTESL